jgi:hypothetical protein
MRFNFIDLLNNLDKKKAKNIAGFIIRQHLPHKNINVTVRGKNRFKEFDMIQDTSEYDADVVIKRLEYLIEHNRRHIPKWKEYIKIIKEISYE